MGFNLACYFVGDLSGTSTPKKNNYKASIEIPALFCEKNNVTFSILNLMTDFSAQWFWGTFIIPNSPEVMSTKQTHLQPTPPPACLREVLVMVDSDSWVGRPFAFSSSSSCESESESESSFSPSLSATWAFAAKVSTDSHSSLSASQGSFD